MIIVRQNDTTSVGKMASFAHLKPIETGYYIAIIGDEDTVTGFLLTGVGQVEAGFTNFLIVREKTPLEEIEQAFQRFTEREDVAILLINQHIANRIRELINDFDRALPSILEIPSKDHPYRPEDDKVYMRVCTLLGAR